jgi:hypothetical protein
MQEPQFQGQTKDRLNNPELVSQVDGVVRPALEHWLNHNISVAESIVARIILAARAQASRAAQARVSPQERHLGATEPAGQTERLHQFLERAQRDLHRRGRFGWRIGGSRDASRAAGHPTAARQGARTPRARRWRKSSKTRNWSIW